MLEVENILIYDEFFADNVDTLKEGIEQHKKRESVKDAISAGKVYLQGGKNNEHVKGLIKPAMQLSKKYMLNIQYMNYYFELLHAIMSCHFYSSKEIGFQKLSHKYISSN